MLLLAIVFLAFVSLGLPDGVLGVAWPSIRDAYGLSQASYGLIVVGAGPGYFLSGLTAGEVLTRLGLGRTLVASTALVATGLGAIGSGLPWPWPIVALGVVGLGSGTIDAGINAFSSARLSARQLNWLHASHSLGAATGPAIMTYALTAGSGWQAGYRIIAAVMLGMTALFAVAGGRLAMPDAAAGELRHAATASGLVGALRHPLVPVQTALFFVYTGCEATIGFWSFTLLTEGRGVRPETAGFWTSAYFGAIFVGRIVLGFLVERAGADRLVRAGTVGALAGALLFAAGPPLLAYAGMVLAGFSLAPIFPTLISRTSARVPARIAVHAVGLKVSAAMMGAAGLPIAAGLSAQMFGLGAVGPIVVAAAAALLILHEALIRATRRHGEGAGG